MGLFGLHKTRMISADEALPGQAEQMPVPARHAVRGTPLRPPYPEGSAIAEYALAIWIGVTSSPWPIGRLPMEEPE